MSKRVLMLTAAMLVTLTWVVYSFQQSLLSAAPAGSAQSPGKAGTTPTIVEDFALKDENGQTVRLSNYKGQIVALVFYASW